MKGRAESKIIECSVINIAHAPNSTLSNINTPQEHQNQSASRIRLNNLGGGRKTTWKCSAMCTIAALGGSCMLIILCIALVIPTLQIAFGTAYRHQCPINEKIPVYLIVAGCYGVALVLFTLIMALVVACCMKRGTRKSTFVASISSSVSVLVLVMMNLLSLVWLIVGSVWVFQAKSIVQHTNAQLNTYCQGTLYNFALAILIIEYVMIPIRCLTYIHKAESSRHDRVS